MGAPADEPTSASEPLSMWMGAAVGPPPATGVRALHFELTSRGDRVPGTLWLPEAPGAPAPLVLLAHGAGGSRHAEYLRAMGLPWVARGAAVAMVDLPLHGERQSAKLTQWLLEGVAAGARLEGSRRRLAAEVVRQTVADWQRTLDALSTLPEVDAARSAFVGVSLGAITGAHFVAADPRPRAAVLALAGGGLTPPELDPAPAVASAAPRPVLLVNAERDERIPRDAAERLAAAAGPASKQLWFDAPHHQLPGRALRAMWEFLAEHLDA